VPVTGTISASTSAVEGTADPTQFARSELPDDAIGPTITGIDFEGDDVILSVRDTMPNVNYVARHYKGEVCEGATPATGEVEKVGGGGEKVLRLRIPVGIMGTGFFFES